MIDTLGEYLDWVFTNGHVTGTIVWGDTLISHSYIDSVMRANDPGKFFEDTVVPHLLGKSKGSNRASRRGPERTFPLD